MQKLADPKFKINCSIVLISWYGVMFMQSCNDQNQIFESHEHRSQTKNILAPNLQLTKFSSSGWCPPSTIKK
jgi:hypothetical protein